MIKDLLSYNIPIKADNFFVKKAEIELREKFENDTSENLKYIGKILDIKIDRELGSKHPKHSFIYPVNYGYIPNTVSGDNEELDCYLLGVFDPVKEYKGKVIAVIHRTNDNDDKLVVVPEGSNYTNDQINALVEFQEKYFKHVILR
ncbi:MAG: inorganic diphosphatase [Bacilli bacterium]|nr:inorganic diphosphatase [Bacilli bacterium]